MAIDISPEIQARLADIADRGDYNGVNDILDDALTLLEERQRFQHLKELLAVGAEQVARGELIPYDDDFLAEMKRSALRRFEAGETPSPDVCP